MVNFFMRVVSYKVQSFLGLQLLFEAFMMAFKVIKFSYSGVEITAGCRQKPTEEIG